MWQKGTDYEPFPGRKDGDKNLASAGITQDQSECDQQMAAC